MMTVLRDAGLPYVEGRGVDFIEPVVPPVDGWRESARDWIRRARTAVGL